MSDCISISRKNADLILAMLYRLDEEIAHELEYDHNADALALWLGDQEENLKCINLLENVLHGADHEGVEDDCM